MTGLPALCEHTIRAFSRRSAGQPATPFCGWENGVRDNSDNEIVPDTISLITCDAVDERMKQICSLSPFLGPFLGHLVGGPAGGGGRGSEATASIRCGDAYPGRWCLTTRAIGRGWVLPSGPPSTKTGFASPSEQPVDPCERFPCVALEIQVPRQRVVRRLRRLRNYPFEVAAERLAIPRHHVEVLRAAPAGQQ